MNRSESQIDATVPHPGPASSHGNGIHAPGRVATTTALRILLANAGIRASEEMVFGIAGGIGAGVFTFNYGREGWSSLFIAGRHLWHDFDVYLRNASLRFGFEPVVTESGGARTAERQLREMLQAHGACIAWVEMSGLPYRAVPTTMSGSGYHVLTVYGIDDATGTVTVGDLAAEPDTISLQHLTSARGRIKKDNHRLLALGGERTPRDLRSMVIEGLTACHGGLVEGRMENFTIKAFERMGMRAFDEKDRERWEKIFPIGHNLLRALTSLNDYIEHYGTGGGLSRTIFADFLEEASQATDIAGLSALAARYREIGRGWSELAAAALPDDVPLLRETREILARKAELARQRATDEVRESWSRLGEIQREAGERFPLSDQDAAALRRSLGERILALYDAEVAAHAALGEIIGA